MRIPNLHEFNFDSSVPHRSSSCDPLDHHHASSGDARHSHAARTTHGAPTQSPFVVELVAEFWEGLRQTYNGKWQKIADQQKVEVFTKESKDELKKLAQMISVPPELLKDDKPIGGGGTAASSMSEGNHYTEAMESLLRNTSVCSTASFFASAKADTANEDELIVLAIPAQATPTMGKAEKLRLELYRTQRLQFSGRLSAAHRAGFDTAWASQPGMDETAGDTFALACDASDSTGYMGTVLRRQGYVSTKGAPRSATQLCDLLRKPGREDLLKMYQDDSAEFSIPVDDLSASMLMTLTGK